MSNERKRTLALFYCQNVPESDENNRRTLEKRHGSSVRLFPIPCSGRLEILHLMRALEEFADAAFVLTCPEGACKYFEGNRRAKKRVERAQSIIESIGLEKERLGIIIGSTKEQKSLAGVLDEILETLDGMPLSPVHGGKA